MKKLIILALLIFGCDRPKKEFKPLVLATGPTIVEPVQVAETHVVEKCPEGYSWATLAWVDPDFPTNYPGTIYKIVCVEDKFKESNSRGDNEHNSSNK